MEKIKHYIKKIYNRTDFSGLSVLGRGQRFDWEILLAFFFVVIIIAVSFSVHVFLGVRAGDIFQEAYQAPVHNVNINKKALDQLVKDFAVRADNLKNLRIQKPVFVDPSL